MWINVTRFTITPGHTDDLRDYLLGPAFSFARESNAHILSFLMSEETDPRVVRSVTIWRSKAAGEAIFESRHYETALATIEGWLLMPPTRTGHRGLYVDVHEVPSLIPPS